MYDSVTLWTVAHQSPLSMGFFSQEYWSGLPFSSSRGSPSARDSNPVSPALQADSLPIEPSGKPFLKLVIIKGERETNLQLADFPSNSGYAMTVVHDFTIHISGI